MNSFLTALGLTVISVAAVFVGLRGLSVLVRSWRIFVVAASLVYYGAVLWVRPSSFIFSDVGVVLASTAGAFLLAILLGNKGAVIAFSITAAVVDILSFYTGPSRHVIDAYQGAGRLLEYLTVFIATESLKMAVIGIGDLVVVGTLFQALCRMEYPVVTSGMVLISAVLLSLVVGWILGGIPAVPFFAAGVIAYVQMRSRTGIHVSERTCS
jgi:hypothetical protein